VVLVVENQLFGHLFAQLGVKLIDADTISHQLVLPGNAALSEIVEHFGQDVRLENGHLNRPFLKTLIFRNPDAKKQLETILHPENFAKKLNINSPISPTTIVL
jgi:dephospho-CoA kinase